MKGIKQTKIPLILTEDNLLKIAIEQGAIDIQFNWKLIRLGDGMVQRSKEIMWLKFGEDGRLQEKHTEPAIGRSLIMSPFNDFFTWQTTDIKEIIENREGYVKFKTGNSTYELSKIENEIDNQ